MKGLRLRVALVALAASATALVALLALVGPGLRQRATGSLQQTLLAEARLMAHVVEEPLARGEGPDTLDPLVDAAAGEVGARVTVIRPDGRVVADSARSGAELLAMENHGRRPEVLAAMATGNGASVRHSATIHEDMLYTAVPVRSDGRLVGVVRVARPLSDLAAQVAELWRALLVALAIAFVITATASTLLSFSLVGPLRDLMTAARRIGKGELGVRVPVRRSDEIGELARILDGARELLQQRFAETARDRARLTAILSSVADGVLAIDHRGTVVAVSDSLSSLLPGDVLGRSYLEAFRQRQVVDVADAVLSGHGRHASADVELPPAGRVFSVSAVPFPGPEGEPPGAVLTFQDVTARHRLEAVRREFVANASHELRTPLTSIRGFVEALEDGALRDPEKGPRFLEKIRRHADRMAALLDDLLELSRLESGERAPERTPVSVPELVESVVSELREAAAGRGLALAAECEGVPQVLSDPERLQRILVNLLDNAIKYTPAGGHVAVRCRLAPTGGAVLEVSDDGPGIPAEHQARIFERFYRIDKARSREAGGTGLGLSIVKHAAESIGARVSLDSAAGRGARFTVELP